MYSKTPTVYIGYDIKEDMAFQVAVASIKKHASKPINIVPLKQEALRRAGLFKRSHYTVEEQRYDCFDRKPFSTDFSFTRFLIPALNQYEGLALYIDCDMLFRSDIWELFDSICIDESAIWSVHHDYNPTSKQKMSGQVQSLYNRKNWSSFVVFNCSHDANKLLTVDDVSVKNGSWLHSFQWLEDQQIGKLNEEWNWLDGWSPDHVNPKNVHFTTGGPQFINWKHSRAIDKIYVQEWENYRFNLLKEEAMKTI
tara:strand:- start:1034 stop:1792 length:759 start_codon:yes stop_codon:yes gene_type:complete